MTNFIYKHGILSAIFLIWAMIVVSYATGMMFADISVITTQAVAAYSALLGIPATAVALYKWRNSNNVSNTNK